MNTSRVGIALTHVVFAVLLVVGTLTPTLTMRANESSPGGVAGQQADLRLRVILDDINKKKRQVEKYDSASPNKAFEIETPYWMRFAVSKRARESYFKDVQANDAYRSALNQAFDSLAEAAAAKLPVYKPSAEVFHFRDPAGEQMAGRGMKNATTLRVHRIGFEEATWLIEKNDLGIPLNRYKHGYMWGRDSADDHSYCHLYVFYLQQNYSGGGTYSQTFTKIRDDRIVGCP